MSVIISANYSALQGLLSGIAFLLLVACVITKTALLRKRGVRAMVFGQTNKSDFFLIPVILAVVYASFARSLGLPMWSLLLKPFWSSSAPGWFGLALCALAVVVLIMALSAFGNSFRVGIDVKDPDELITKGIFSISRNPIYLCFLFVLAGLFLIHRNLVMAFAAAAFVVVIHRQVLREEKFLEDHYGEEYLIYRKKVRRYF